MGAKKIGRLGLVVSLAWLIAAPAWGRELKVLSYNVWGISGAKYRPERMAEIARRIKELDPEIVVLAEAFEPAHREILLQGLREQGFPLATEHYYANGGYGSGVWVLSKYPAVEEGFQGFRVYVPAGRGEQKMGKGMAALRLHTPEGDLLLVGLHALSRTMPLRLGGRVIQTDARKCNRLLEMFEIADLVQQEQAETGVRAVIVAGDFNVSPELLEYQLLLARSGLKNSFDALHPGENPPTFSFDNPFVFPHIQGMNQRIDHILFRNFVTGQGPGLAPEESRVVMKETFALPSGRQIHTSDHYGMFTVFGLDGAQGQAGAIQSQAGISAAEADQLLRRVKQSDLKAEPELWTRFALSILKSSDEKIVYKSRAVKAAAKVIVDVNGGADFPLHWRDRRALRGALSRASYGQK